MAAAVTILTQNSVTTNVASYTAPAAGTVTPTANSQLVVVVSVTAETSSNWAVTDSLGGTWSKPVTRRTKADTTSGTDILEVWLRDLLVPASAMSVTYSHASGNATGCILAVLQVTGMDRQGILAHRSSGGEDNIAGGGTPAPVLSSTPLTANAIITACLNGANPNALTRPTGYVQRDSRAINTPTTGQMVASKDTGVTNATITWGATSATAYASVAIELDAAIYAIAAVAGAGTVAATGTRTRFGAADVAGAGTVAASGTRTRFGAAAVAGTGAISATGTRTRLGAAAIAGAGTISASATVTTPAVTGEANVTGTGTISASGTRKRLGAAAVSGTGTVSATGTRKRLGQAQVAGQGSISASGEHTGVGIANVSGTGTVSAAAFIGHFGAADIAGTGTISGTGAILYLGSGAILGTGTISANGFAYRPWYPSSDTAWPEDDGTGWPEDDGGPWTASVGAGWGQDTDDEWE